MLNDAMDIVKIKVNKEVWNIVDSQNGTINLRRKIEAYCEVCERPHEHENSFVSVNKWGDVMFHCWREIDTGGTKSIKIGDVKSDYLEVISKQHIASVIAKLTKRPTVSPQPIQRISSKEGKLTTIDPPFTGSVRMFIRNMATGQKPSYL